jgi:hypothetical protein
MNELISALPAPEACGRRDRQRSLPLEPPRPPLEGAPAPAVPALKDVIEGENDAVRHPQLASELPAGVAVSRENAARPLEADFQSNG